MTTTLSATAVPAAMIPGPKGHWAFGSVPEFRRDPLRSLVAALNEHGDAVRFRFVKYDAYFFSRPDAIKHVLQDNQANYVKSRGYRKMKDFLGEGLITSEGAVWRQQRRIAQPSFNRDQLDAIGSTVAMACDKLAARWQTRIPAHHPINVHAEMIAVTMWIAAAALFSYDVSESEGEELSEALVTLQTHTMHRIQSFIDVPVWLPTRRNRRFVRAVRTLDALVNRIVEGRRAGDWPRSHLLSALLDGADGEPARRATAREVRDQIVTLFFAGHETSANVLTWTAYILSQRPEVEVQLRDEVDRVLNGRTPTPSDMTRLPYLTMVVQETMRLYPPAWVIERESLEEDVVSGYRLPPRSFVILSPFAMHRHPAYWPEPEEFRPDRFERQAAANRPRYAYIPFGGGPRHCIGSNLAMMEIVMILAVIVQRFRLSLVRDQTIVPLPRITLSPRSGLWMAAEPRS